MKQFLLAAAVLTASLSAPASAADLARPRAHAVYGPAVAFYNWTGCYVGGNGGGSGLGETGPIQCSGAEVSETRPRAVD